MTASTPDIRIDWRGDGFAIIANDGFEADTSGWLATAGINAAATSITRSTGDFYLGAACGVLVTTATSGSGTNYDFGSRTFTAGRTYRFRIALKSVSGTTSAKLVLGSLGTPADRATATMTLTTSWVLYQVDWTPSSNRTDVEAVVSSNAASTMTVRLDSAELYEALCDVSADADFLTYSRGANFDGSSEAPGTCTISVNNIDGRYNKRNAAGPYYGLLKIGRKVWIRARYLGVLYPVFYGDLRRILSQPRDHSELYCEDPLYVIGRAEGNIGTTDTRSLRDFRGVVLDSVGITSDIRSLAYGPEIDRPITGWSGTALSALEAVNAATGSIHFIRPGTSGSLRCEYVTIDRTQMQTGAAIETYADDVTGTSGWDDTDELVDNLQRVQPIPRTFAVNGTVWTATSVPFDVTPGASRTIWVAFDDAVLNQAVVYSATNAPTVTLTPFGDTAKIVITAGGTASSVSALSVIGRAAVASDLETAVSEDTASQTTYGVRRGSDIASEFLASTAYAQGLADWWTYRYADQKARPNMTVTNRFPSQLQREIGDRIALTYPLLSLSAEPLFIRSLTTTVDMGAAQWVTVYGLEEAPVSVVLFTIGGTADQGIGGSGVLAR